MSTGLNVVLSLRDERDVEVRAVRAQEALTVTLGKKLVEAEATAKGFEERLNTQVKVATEALEARDEALLAARRETTRADWNMNGRLQMLEEVKELRAVRDEALLCAHRLQELIDAGGAK